MTSTLTAQIALVAFKPGQALALDKSTPHGG